MSVYIGKPEPSIVTTVPPCDEPRLGVTEETFTEAWYSKRSSEEVKSIWLVEICTDAFPTACSGVLHMIVDDVTYVAGVKEYSPNRQMRLGESTKFPPSIVTSVPPYSGPRTGAKAEMYAGASNVNWMELLVEVRSSP
jgi:hypothetical protein